MISITIKYLILKVLGKAKQVCDELNELIKNDDKIKLATPIFNNNISKNFNNEKNGYCILECHFNTDDTTDSILSKVQYYIASIFGCNLLNKFFLSYEKGQNILKKTNQIIKKDNEYFTQRKSITIQNFKLFNKSTEFYWKTFTVQFDKILNNQFIRIKILMFQRQVLMSVPYKTLSLKKTNQELSLVAKEKISPNQKANDK